VKTIYADYKVFMYKNGIPTCLFCVCCTLCAVAIALIGTDFRASAQTPSTDKAFEVATVKPVDPSYRFDGKHIGAHVNPAGASYWYMTPIGLIAYAYDVRLFQVAGPDWANHARFDVEGRFPEGADMKDDHTMLQALLKDRFKLAFHIEERQLDGYALVVGKHGEKLRPSPPDPASSETDAPLKQGDGNVGEAPAQPKITQNPDGSSTVDMGKRGTQTTKFDQELGARHFERSKMTMEELAGSLSSCLGTGRLQKVVDETGIKGTYQVAWDCPSLRPRSSIGTGADGTLASDPQDGSSLTRSLDVLGLKLEKRKTLQEVYVIDHVEMPSKN
jgi:uncharacterized protein (TIGR03435 family)